MHLNLVPEIIVPLQVHWPQHSVPLAVASVFTSEVCAHAIQSCECQLPITLLHYHFRILDILDKRITFQLQYQLIFCLWNLSFNPTVVEKMKE